MDTPILQLPEGVPTLDTYYMYISGGCNLACRHCWITPSFEANGGTGECLDYGLYELAIQQALPLGLHGIKYTGGEPLLHPEFVRMVDFATELRLRTWMETNGTLMTPELARHLKEKTTLNFISVSLDGASAQSHDHMRNVPGSFERACRGIQNLVEAGYAPQIIMSLYPGNVDEIEALVMWAEKSGCGSVKFNLIQPSGRGVGMKARGEWLELEELITLGRWIEKDLRQKVSIPLLYSWPLAFQGIHRLYTQSSGVCDIEHVMGLLSSGHLSMCGIGILEKDLVYGQVGQDDLREVWCNHPGLKEVRDTVAAPLEGICANCLHQGPCKGNCLAQNYFASKRLTASYWFCQMAEEENLFPVARKRKVC
jgi:SynChlorMet cassette radical SAM/SPASM protein ScmF